MKLKCGAGSFLQLCFDTSETIINMTNITSMRDVKEISLCTLNTAFSSCNISSS